jgi:Uma2 family endonuclease
MTLVREPTTLTIAEYLVLERAADYKSEYINGERRPMPGASRKHNLVTGNIYASLHVQLRKSRCEIYPSDMRVKVEATKLITYPDISIVCGEPRFDDSHKDTLLNPTVLIEVLSPSTAAYDRGDKSENYRQIPSLQVYLLVAQDRMHIEYYSRQPDNSWRFTEFKRSGDHFILSPIQCELVLEDIYEKVALEQPSVLNGQSHQE